MRLLNSIDRFIDY